MIAFETILDQTQAYENMVEHVVDSLRYITFLSFDVLSYTLVEARPVAPFFVFFVWVFVVVVVVVVVVLWIVPTFLTRTSPL